MANDIKFRMSMEGAKVVSQHIGGVTKDLSDMDRQTGLAAAGMKALTAMTGGFSAALTIGKLVTVQREFDVLNSSLITVTGSTAAAAREMAWIKDFAKETPFGLAQATQGFVKMKALGLDPSRASLTSFGNTASAMGKDLNQMIEAVADASTGEFERLKEFGVKAKQNGDQVSLTFQGVTTSIGNNAQEIKGYLEDLGNNQFAGAMAERAKTLDGAIAGLGDTWDELFRTVNTNNAGGFIYDSVTLATKAIEDVITVMNAMSGAADGNAKSTGAMATVQEVLAVTFETVAVLGANVKYVLVQVGTELGGIAAQAVQFLQGNFSAAAAIRQSMVADGIAARADMDATTQRILSGRKDSAAAADVNATASARLARQGVVDAEAIAAAHGKAGKAAKGLSDAQKEAAKAQKLLNDLNLEAMGFKPDFAAQWTALAKLQDGTDGLTVAQAELLSQQPLMVDAAKAQADVLKDQAKLADDYEQAQRKAITTSETEVTRAQAAFDAHGKLASVLAEEALARDINTLAAARMGGEDATVLLVEIENRRKLIQILKNGEVRDASEEAAKNMLADQKKAAEESGKYWEDALMRAFESGKGFFESLWDTIKNTLKTQVLKVMVQGTMGAVGIGASGAAMASGSGGLDILNTASSIGSLYSAGTSIISLGSQVVAGTMGIANALGTMAANATGTGISGLLAANGAYGTAAAGTASAAAGSVTGALAAIGPAGWAAIGVMAVAAIASGRGETRSGATYDTGTNGLARYQQGPSGGEIAGGTAQALFNATKTSIEQTLKLVGSSAAVTGFTAGLESSGNGKGFAFAGGYVGGTSFGDSAGRNGALSGQWAYQTMNNEQAMAAYVNELKKSTLEALQAATDIPNLISSQLAGINISALDQKGLDALVESVNGTINAVNSFGQQLNTSAIKELHDIGFAAAAGLIAASGGLENLQANLGSYYSNFYSTEEQRLQTIQQINAATAGSGLNAATATREQFRQITEAQDLTTESGRATYAALLGVSGAFAGLVPVIEDTTKAAEEAAKAAAKAAEEVAAALAKTNQGWSDQLAVLLGTETERSIALRDTADDSTRAIMRQVYAQEDLAAASAEAASALADAQSGLQSLISSITSERANVAGAVSGILGVAPRTPAQIAAAALAAMPSMPGKAALENAEASVVRLSGDIASMGDLKTRIEPIAATWTAREAALTTQSAAWDKYAASATTANALGTSDALRGNYLETLQHWVLQLDGMPDRAKAAQSASFMVAPDQTGAGIKQGLSEAGLLNVANVGPTSKTLSAAQSSALVAYANGMKDFYAARDAYKSAASDVASKTTAVNTAQGAAWKDPSITDPMYALNHNGYYDQTAVDAVQKQIDDLNAEKLKALGAVASATTAYAASLVAFTGDASKATEALGKLRTETVAYYEAQKASSTAMLTSASNLREAVKAISTTQLDPLADARQKQADWSKNYSLALATSGTVQAGYADQMTAMLPALSEALKATSTLSDWRLATAQFAAQSTKVADQLTAAGSVDYQAESLSALNSIDGYLATLQSDAAIISAAVGKSGANTVSAISSLSQNMGYTAIGIPALYTGTNYTHEGLHYLHEGEAVVPRVYNPAAGGGGGQINAELVAEIRALRESNQRLEQRLANIDAAAESSAVSNANTAASVRTLELAGIQVWTDPIEPIKTVAT